MDEITEYLWQEQLAQPPTVAADTPPVDAAATTPPQSQSPAPAPAPEQPYQPNLDQLLRALSNPEVREALVKLLQPR
ncbi:hypothetical protein HDC36_001810 [Xanthomonas sp. JAI131]|uniref:hypothetical protein n=1 Tax=Xanthomonas sp. JAI131 TaxID=2723067 RepID=UPI0015C7F97E|nr:hypothetical protein [Xanthomonas sp. JAI131]NYF20349.1 hypothetical protein [Xanthomonas sp. JAI131]